jgi:FlaA1/EpsC-like NDP-sugar epimerase
MQSKSVAGRRVLITGAGGSIGSALSHAVAASKPTSLMLLDSSENALYQVDRSLREGGSGGHVAVLGSVGDPDTLDATLKRYRPEIIFHTAALKHVPLMERNPFAAMEQNVLSTQTLMDAAITHGIEQLVHVSTDKAVEPCSIMGASKRIAELLLLSSQSSTRIKVVRLCNVIGSQGSVLPLFLEQMEQGVTLTVTHPDAERFFITLDEAVRAMLDASEIPCTKALLIPSIGQSVVIVDLARHVLETRGSAALIEFTGLRAGDKLSERLMSSREALSAVGEHDSSALREIKTPLPDKAVLSTALEMLYEAVGRRELGQLLRGVCWLVPEYQPSSVILTALDEATALAVATEMRA